ncbi:MAG: FGGY-family carbohydrate kinase [Pseudomonadota bacterium]
MTGLSLGIDIGTSGIRTAVLDVSGTLVSEARVKHLDQDPDRVDARHWWKVVLRCVALQRGALRELGRDLSDVVRVSVDGTSGTMVLTDTDLNPVSRALMYNSTGFEAEAAHIACFAPDVHVARGANGAFARALRLQAEAPEAVHLLHQADYIIARLRGVGGVSDHNNALKLGFDPETQCYPSWFGETDIRNELLPKVVPAGTPLGPMARDVATELGFSNKVIVHAGTTDSVAAFLAAAPLEEGAAVTSLGTTLAVKVLSARRIDDPAVGLYAHKVGDVWLAGGASNTGGGVLATLFSTQELGALSAQIDPMRVSPLDYYPLLKPGERFPVNDPHLAPRLEPRPENDADYLHGILESIARIEAQCYQAITARGGGVPQQLFTAGGGAKNDVWTRIRERVLGIEISQPQHAEAAVGLAKLIMRT